MSILTLWTLALSVKPYAEKYKSLLPGLAVIILLALFQPVNGQQVSITAPQLKMVNDSLIIVYEFMGGSKADKFHVGIEITDSAGRIIPAHTLTGDIGDSISGGAQKQIIWNLKADNIIINQNLYIEVIGERQKIPEEEPVQAAVDTLATHVAENRTQTQAQKPPEAVIKESATSSIGYKKNNFLLSMVFPGWGLTRLSDGKPYWLIGVAGVGCIAASVYFNQQAVKSYDNYKQSMDAEKSEDYFNQAEQQYLISNICAYAAIGIWVLDLGAVAIRANHVKKAREGIKLSHMTVGPAYYFPSRAPALSVQFHF